MAGLFTLALAGVAFVAIAALESLPSKPSPFLRYLSAALLSSLTIFFSLISALRSPSSDLPLPLSTAAAAALFLLYALAGLLSLLRPRLLPLPSSLLDLLLLAAFAQELLLLSLRRKDPDGIETRYFTLLTAPVLLCAVSTLASISRPRAAAPRLARAAGLALHGTWLVQMAFSFFSTAMAYGCALHRRSHANYTIKCKGHPDYHRARAIATLQFNGHLALLTVACLSVFAVYASGRSLGGQGYRPLNTELRRMGNISSSQFTLDSDEEGEEGRLEATGSKSKLQHDVVLPVSNTNGVSGSH